MGGRVVEMDVWVFRQPAVDLGLVGVQVVQDDVNFLIRVVHYEFVHKPQKLPSSAPLEVTGFDQPGRHVQGGEQGGRTVAFILVVEARQSFAIGQFEPSLGAFQRLDCRLLVYAKNYGVPNSGVWPERSGACARYKPRIKRALRQHIVRQPLPHETPEFAIFSIISGAVPGRPRPGFAGSIKRDPNSAICGIWRLGGNTKCCNLTNSQTVTSGRS